MVFNENFRRVSITSLITGKLIFFVTLKKCCKINFTAFFKKKKIMKHAVKDCNQMRHFKITAKRTTINILTVSNKEFSTLLYFFL